MYKMCKRFRKCENGIEDLISCLETQRAIFKNETILLLKPAVGLENAKCMTRELDHELWSDPSTKAQLGQLLGDGEETLAIAAETARKKMQEFEEEIQSLKSENGEALIGSKEWRKSLKRKFKYTFSESKFRDLSTSIREATHEYRTLRQQIQQINLSDLSGQSDNGPFRDTQQSRATRTAAKRLYEALILACTRHTKHYAYINLRPTCVLAVDESQVRFQIGYRHLLQHTPRNGRDTLWFVVESTETTLLSNSATVSPVSSPLKLKRSRLQKLERLKGCFNPPAKRARCRSPSPSDLPICNVSPTNHSKNTSPDSPDLTATADLCNRLYTCTAKKRDVVICLGWLRDSQQRRHKVYHDAGFTEPSTMEGTDKPRSDTLAEILVSTGKDRTGDRRLTVTQRLRLAKLLSMAVLDFNATPWMAPSWCSSDIILHNASPLSSGETGPENIEVFMNVKVESGSVSSAEDGTAVNVLQPFIRNLTLFNLGVLLLELAFEEPLRQKPQSSKNKAGSGTAIMDLHTISRKSKQVSKCLGIPYAKVVEKCLHCDFGQGADLESPTLQNAVYRDVVAELEKLEKRFQELGLA